MKCLQLKKVTSLVALLFVSVAFSSQALAAAAKPPVITSPSTKSCVVGTACDYTITASNSPTSYNATGLQSWQSRSTNVISGTPTASGTFFVTVSATNSAGTGSLGVTFTVTPPPARVVVAPSGGHYTTISAALNDINPTEANPYVIEVWPGVYTETGTVVMKSYVHLKGSGRDVTTVKTALGTTANVILVEGKTNVTISGLTISGGYFGVMLRRSTTSGYSATVSDNTISNNRGYGIGTQCGGFSCSLLITGNMLVANLWGGLDLEYTSATVVDNFISGNGTGMTNSDAGITSDGTSTSPVLVKGNVISGNNGVGIQAWGLQFTISDNIVTNNTLGGVQLLDGASADTITHNNIFNNGGMIYTDILLDPPAVPNISFNVFNTITGTTGVGSYNVTSNGDPILVP